MQNSTISIGIVDDHTLFRQGLISLLSEYNSIKFLFEAGNGQEMQQHLKNGPLPNVILLDISMPVMDGYQTVQWLRQHHPAIHILALSTFEEDMPIIKMLKSGAGGYLLKESRIGEVVNAIQSIYEQGFYLNEVVSGKMLHSLQGKSDSSTSTSHLSENEIRFLQLCCSEMTYKEMAVEMNLSPHTIDNYRQALFEKLDIKSRTGLVIYAIKHAFYIP
ncbi:DNA-binding NarL/FixJ family response regulator [Chitinophaga dinghuensis]|uniref:DNA-binding NarL/FixJ family response regulator n=1 Tax=Chitinophaga dinghuensis TaxID=1539050 RepID=A0A327VME8_9BACT|nr:response regulator transcription factor [Chitinophaga dinghuensis]RAJ74983.1 DNA-binding NarL/FixJ family response regulator [Chitinophaga dinghuensis]